MKKLLFVFAFAFIGQQAFSQIYIVTLSSTHHQTLTHVTCPSGPFLSIIAPNGTVTYNCLNQVSTSLTENSNILGAINQELNAIISQGYKLIETNNGWGVDGLIGDDYVNLGTTWYFAIP